MERAPAGGLATVVAELGPERCTYPGLVRALGEVAADAPALTCGSQRLTYGELCERIGTVVAHLCTVGLASGGTRDVPIAVLMDNHVDTVVVHLALQVLGRTVALVNTSYTGEALRNLLALSKADTVVVDQLHADAVAEVRDLLEMPPALLRTWDPEFQVALHGKGVITEHSEVVRPASPEDPAFITYTSGTTGLPKGVVLKQAFSIAGLVLARRVGMRAGQDRIYLPTPMYHALGLSMVSLALRMGDELIIAPRFSASRYWDDIRAHHCTVAYHVGTMAQMLMRQPPSPMDASNEVWLFVGGGMPADIWEAFSDRFGVEIVEMYAASDGVGTIGNYGDAPPGSIGRPDPELEVRLVDDDGGDVPAGTAGELLVRPRHAPPGPLVEYHNDPVASASKVPDGWVHTGDLVRADEDGNLYFVDRKKDAIRRRGVNIAPAEIERILGRHPRIRECAALAVPADLGEDDIKLLVVVDGLDEGDVVDLCGQFLPSHMQPRYVELVAQLPKTVTQRVQRYRLKHDWETASTYDVARRRFIWSPGAGSTTDGAAGPRGAE
ncbi:MAG: AMP-binding protein [Acidimicrobiales bacterium]